jgi:membrane-associated protein
MALLKQFADIVLHLDRHLADVIAQYGTWTYAILFGIIFCETGLVVLPLLPGDSLLFAAGSFAALGSLRIGTLFTLLAVAAVAGDTLNYSIGRRIGLAAFSGRYRFFKLEYLERTRDFFTRHGGKTIIIARFVPIIRTFAPFVAGVGEMSYPRFFAYNVVGGVGWVALLTFGGYFFGNLPVVREHFGLVIFAIIVISVAPIALELLRGIRRRMARVDS